MPALLMLVVCCCILACLSGNGYAAAYYIAQNGDDAAAGTSRAPWSTFTRAMKALKPGDTLYLKDGTYDQQLNVTVSGAKGAYITIAAVNEGNAVVRTGYPRSSLILSGSYIEINGINFRNSGTACSGHISNDCGYKNVHGLNIGGNHDITLRRITANGSSGYNSAVINLTKTKNALIEDCAASGQGRVVLNMLGCDNVTVRRCWLNWSGPDTGGGDTNSISQIYDSSHVLMENNIGLNLTTTPGDGLGIWAHYENTTHNTLKGNVVYHTAAYSVGGLGDGAEFGQHSSFGWFENNVSIVPVKGAYNSVPAAAMGSDNHTSRNNTYVGSNGIGFYVHERPKRHTQATTVAIENSSFVNLWTGIHASSSGNNKVSRHAYNNYYKVTQCLYNEGQMEPSKLDPTEKCNTLDPGYNTASYGKGAYLVVPAALKGKGMKGGNIGAEVLYRYQDGVLTGKPLWPWPMENRIVAEFGVSPTWETKKGIWKTLDGLYPVKKK